MGPELFFTLALKRRAAERHSPVRDRHDEVFARLAAERSVRRRSRRLTPRPEEG